MTTQATRGRIPGRVEEAIRHLFARGWEPGQIFREIERDQGLKGGTTLRTVQRRVKELRALDTSGVWRLEDDPSPEARTVLDALAAVITYSGGAKRHLTVDEARWVKRVSLASREADGLTRYLAARQYVVKTGLGETTADLDAWLAFEPWRLTKHGKELEEEFERARGEDQAERWWGAAAYARAVEGGWIGHADPVNAEAMMQLQSKESEARASDGDSSEPPDPADDLGD